jgi:hypothetical protein
MQPGITQALNNQEKERERKPTKDIRRETVRDDGGEAANI